MNQNPQVSRFVVDALVPENRVGGQTYQLSDESVSPSRLVQGPDGLWREETLCTLAKSAKFVDRGGNVCDVPLRTGRVLSEEIEAVRYEQIVIADQVRASCIPIDVCPFTMQFAHFKRGPLDVTFTNEFIAAGGKAEDCGGAAQNRGQPCRHMQALITKRRADSRARYDAENQKLVKLTEGDVQAMMGGVAKSFETALANVAQTAADAAAERAAGRKNLRGRGEEG